MGMGEAACSLRSPLNRSRLSRGHALKTDQTTRELDLAHVPEPVLVEPALEAVEHGDAVGSRAARAVGAGDRRRERPGTTTRVKSAGSMPSRWASVRSKTVRW